MRAIFWCIQRGTISGAGHRRPKKNTHLRRNMAVDNTTLESGRPRALAVLRIVTEYLLIPHGTAAARPA